MSTQNLIKRIQKEIEKINEEIDMKITKGLSYKTLSRQHKVLVAELRSLEKRIVPSTWSRGIMSRLSEYASVFLL